MFVQVFFTLSFIPSFLLAAPGDIPLKSKDYANQIKQGFTTHWFKTEDPLSKYNIKIIRDVYNKGFRNLRLRCNSKFFKGSYNSQKFKTFLKNLTKVVDDCLKVGVAPIISWFNYDAEAHATVKDRNHYVNWWTVVAKHLKDKNYLLSFNLFTELTDKGRCARSSAGADCPNSLTKNVDKYNVWTRNAVRAIRKSGGKNSKRILILASPIMTAEGLKLIKESIYEKDKFMMAEFHFYAAGPHKLRNSAKYWTGDGTGRDGWDGRKQVVQAFKGVKEFTAKSGLSTYFAEWQPIDHGKGTLTEQEVLNFARYFVQRIRDEGIPWSLNALLRFYDREKRQWFKGKQKVRLMRKDGFQTIDVENVLRTIKNNM